jgi:hypothetical protein
MHELRYGTRLTLHSSMQIPISLQSHPQLRWSLKKAPQSKRRIGGNSAFAENYLIQAVEWDAKAAGSRDLSEAERLEIFLQEDLAGRNRRTEPIRLSSDSLRRRLHRHDHSPIETWRDTDWCHPDDLSNARGGNGFWPPDSFAHAKPVPVSEIAQRSTSVQNRGMALASQAPMGFETIRRDEYEW